MSYTFLRGPLISPICVCTCLHDHDAHCHITFLQCFLVSSTPVNSILELVDIEYFLMDGTTRNAMKPHASHWVHPIYM